MALSTCALGTFDMTSDPQALCADWIYLIQNHKVITQQDWLEGSPKYGVIRYHAPEWHMWATKQHAQKTIQTRKPKRMVDVQYTCWMIQIGDLIVEISQTQEFKLCSVQNGIGWNSGWMDHSWIASLGDPVADQIPKYEISHVGDLSEFEGMITHYRLMCDWH